MCLSVTNCLIESNITISFQKAKFSLCVSLLGGREGNADEERENHLSREIFS